VGKNKRKRLDTEHEIRTKHFEKRPPRRFKPQSRRRIIDMPQRIGIAKPGNYRHLKHLPTALRNKSASPDDYRLTLIDSRSYTHSL
jgi:hypothetical protein